MTAGEDGERAGGVTRISDEQLEYYGDCFMKWDIRKQGIAFERFLACPDYYLARLPSPPQAPRPQFFRRVRRLLSTALCGRRRPSTC